ncbi:hypothetical protein HNY73_009769 [Argiope bruennichi]|uniref:Uncharacterized protein n=1 Tax=Argiope bruennichi TaxID=94029 RepID=A0A8T0FFL9_ARGBR|nr:hypothetical protein HNY73_009769 [Argiope bruennichi]
MRVVLLLVCLLPLIPLITARIYEDPLEPDNELKNDGDEVPPEKDLIFQKNESSKFMKRSGKKNSSSSSRGRKDKSGEEDGEQSTRKRSKHHEVCYCEPEGETEIEEHSSGGKKSLKKGSSSGSSKKGSSAVEEEEEESSNRRKKLSKKESGGSSTEEESEESSKKKKGSGKDSKKDEDEESSSNKKKSRKKISGASSKKNQGSNKDEESEVSLSSKKGSKRKESGGSLDEEGSGKGKLKDDSSKSDESSKSSKSNRKHKSARKHGESKKDKETKKKAGKEKGKKGGKSKEKSEISTTIEEETEVSTEPQGEIGISTTLEGETEESTVSEDETTTEMEENTITEMEEETSTEMETKGSTIVDFLRDEISGTKEENEEEDGEISMQTTLTTEVDTEIDLTEGFKSEEEMTTKIPESSETDSTESSKGEEEETTIEISESPETYSTENSEINEEITTLVTKSLEIDLTKNLQNEDITTQITEEIDSTESSESDEEVTTEISESPEIDSTESSESDEEITTDTSESTEIDTTESLESEEENNTQVIVTTEVSAAISSKWEEITIRRTKKPKIPKPKKPKTPRKNQSTDWEEGICPPEFGLEKHIHVSDQGDIYIYPGRHDAKYEFIPRYFTHVRPKPPPSGYKPPKWRPRFSFSYGEGIPDSDIRGYLLSDGNFIDLKAPLQRGHQSEYHSHVSPKPLSPGHQPPPRRPRLSSNYGREMPDSDIRGYLLSDGYFIDLNVPLERRWYPPRGGAGRPGSGWGPGIGPKPNSSIGKIPPGRKGAGGGMPDIDIGGNLLKDSTYIDLKAPFQRDHQSEYYSHVSPKPPHHGHQRSPWRPSYLFNSGRGIPDSDIRGYLLSDGNFIDLKAPLQRGHESEYYSHVSPKPPSLGHQPPPRRPRLSSNYGREMPDSDIRGYLLSDGYFIDLKAPLQRSHQSEYYSHVSPKPQTIEHQPPPWRPRFIFNPHIHKRTKKVQPNNGTWHFLHDTSETGDHHSNHKKFACSREGHKRRNFKQSSKNYSSPSGADRKNNGIGIGNRKIYGKKKVGKNGKTKGGNVGEQGNSIKKHARKNTIPLRGRLKSKKKVNEKYKTNKKPSNCIKKPWIVIRPGLPTVYGILGIQNPLTFEMAKNGALGGPTGPSQANQYMVGWPSKPRIPPGHVAVPPEALLMPKLPSIPGMPGMPPNTRVVVPWDKLPKQPGIPPGPRRQPPPAAPPISPDQPPAPPPVPPVQPAPKPDKPNGRRWFPPRGGKGRPGDGYGPGIGIGPNATIGQIPGRKGEEARPVRILTSWVFFKPAPRGLLMLSFQVSGMPGMPQNTRVLSVGKLPENSLDTSSPRRHHHQPHLQISPDQATSTTTWNLRVSPAPKPDKPNGRRWFPPRGGKGRPGHGYGPGIGIGPNATIGQIPPGRKGAGGGVPDIDIVGFLQDTSIPERDGPSRQYMFGWPSRPVIPPGHVAVPPEALLMPKLPSIPGMPGMPPNTRVVVPWDKLPKQPGIPPEDNHRPHLKSPDHHQHHHPGHLSAPQDKPNGRRWFPPRGGKGRPGHGYGPGIGSGPNATIGQIPPGRKGGGGGLPDIEIGGFLRDTSEAGRDGTPGVSIGSRRKVRQYTWKPSGSSISRGSNNYLSGKKSRKPLDFRRDGRYKQKRKRKLRKPLDGRRGGRYKQKRKRKLRKPLDGRRDGRYRQKLKRKLRKPLDGRRDGRYRQKLKRKLESVGRKVVQMENKSAKEEQHNNISNRKKYAPTWDRDPPRVNIRRNASPLKKLQKRNKP